MNLMKRSTKNLMNAGIILIVAGWITSPILAGSVGSVTVKELAGMIKSKAKVTVVDANGSGTRKKHGIIPGAVLLTNYSSYNAEKELPADKKQKLVFYCANTYCSAAPKAAEKAIKAGYTNVTHLPEGIMGWNKAGQKAQTYKP